MTSARSFYRLHAKRALDILLCGFALLVLSPLFLLTAVAIKLSSPGPVFYYSLRQGKDKVPFKFYKFRSMHAPRGADKGLCVADADRLFAVGRIIRRLKIDELPQLVNVLRGDMSIVGPRPMVHGGADDFYSGKYAPVASIRPGLTSPASLYDYVVGDSVTDERLYRETVLPVKLELELLYVHKESFFHDTSLVFRTMFSIVNALSKHRWMPVRSELKEIGMVDHA